MRFERERAGVPTPAAKHHSVKLRRETTVPEKRLWTLLRKRLPLDGPHFRQQVALGPYVVDFVCMSERLVLEADGDQHGTDAALDYDSARSIWLAENGFRVLRFTNRQIMTESEMVIDTIFAALTGNLDPGRSPPTPIPSPQGGGEEPR